jgi:glyoxylase I family protein
VTDPTLVGVHHLELTVRDLERSASWYASVLGFDRAGRVDKPQLSMEMLRHPAGILLALTLHHGAAAAGTFDERRVGLDHLAFAVADPAAVDAWARRLDELGVTRSEIKDGSLPGSRLVVFRDPDGIQLECYTSP